MSLDATLQFVETPGVIDLGWGHPGPDLLPVAALRDAAAAALTEHGPDALGYGAAHGPAALRRWLAGHLGRVDGRAPALDELLVTAGASQALDLASTVLTRPGDCVLVPTPTYHLALRILRDHPLTIVPLPTDEGGVRVEAAGELVARLRRAGERPRLLYLVPTFGNPTGITVPPERRRALADLASAEGLTIVEDDVYRELAYDAPGPPSIWSLAEPGSAVRLGSFSKTLAPGLRLGWLTADAETVGRIADCGLIDSGGGLNHFTALVVASFAAGGAYERHLESLRRQLAARRDTLVSTLREAVPAAAFEAPAGGYFAWLRLPDAMDARAFLPVAERHGVSGIAGTVFDPDATAWSDRLRLSFSLYPPDVLADAARRLGRAMRGA